MKKTKDVIEKFDEFVHSKTRYITKIINAMPLWTQWTLLLVSIAILMIELLANR